MLTATLFATLLVAAVGWLATIRVISTSRIDAIKKRILLLPVWVVWLAIALGAPILSGGLSVGDALNVGGALTAGIAMSMLLAALR